MTRVLVVNHAHSEVCGIHDLGKRIAECLRHSTVLEVNCLDIADANGYRSALSVCAPDFVIVNFRADLMPWVRGELGYHGAPAFAVLHQYEEATADARAAELLAAGFDGVLALDPQLRPSDPRVHAVGRPIPETVNHPVTRPGSPVAIGSFGFAFPHKRFAAVAAEIADQCHDVIYNLHMPEAFFNGAEGQNLYGLDIFNAVSDAMDGGRLAHGEVKWTFDHLGERELVARLAANDVNCLFYAPGQPDAGLSSALDYLIAARRPMLVSEASMFRAAWNRPIWPDTRLGDILDNYDHYQQEADVLYNSMAGQLVRDIEQIVSEL